MLPLRRCPARHGLRGRPGDKDAADPASWRRGRRPGRAGQGRAPLRRRRCRGAGPGDAEPRPRCAAPWRLLAAPYSRRRAAARERRARQGSPRRAAPARSLGGSPVAPALPPRRCTTGAVSGRDSSRCGARRLRAGRRDRGASCQAARAGLTARRPRPRARTAPAGRAGARSRRAGQCPRRGPRKAPRRPRTVSAGTMAGLARTLGIFSAFVAVVGAAFYPIYFRPLLLPEEYKKEQSINRAGIVQESIQPAGLKVWSDPFGRK
ncbi:small integral membrane protein 20 isoform X2 [Prinia subflava]|uniref:small integral membrane protein 20 isoform X2 n=1 Tax=Prinia subflava TaxID=208062 RepID=UPI002FE3F89D